MLSLASLWTSDKPAYWEEDIGHHWAVVGGIVGMDESSSRLGMGARTVMGEFLKELAAISFKTTWVMYVKR